jgi:hypothetical protein
MGNPSPLAVITVAKVHGGAIQVGERGFGRSKIPSGRCLLDQDGDEQIAMGLLGQELIEHLPG